MSLIRKDFSKSSLPLQITTKVVSGYRSHPDQGVSRDLKRTTRSNLREVLDPICGPLLPRQGLGIPFSRMRPVPCPGPPVGRCPYHFVERRDLRRGINRRSSRHFGQESCRPSTKVRISPEKLLQWSSIKRRNVFRPSPLLRL